MMANPQPQRHYEIGMAGRGVMGCTFLLNMADQGFSVAGYDKNPAKDAALRQVAGQFEVPGATDIGEFISVLRSPRAIMMLIPAATLEAESEEIWPLLIVDPDLNLQPCGSQLELVLHRIGAIND